jgi:hypothetical protein
MKHGGDECVRKIVTVSCLYLAWLCYPSRPSHSFDTICAGDAVLDVEDSRASGMAIPALWDAGDTLGTTRASNPSRPNKVVPLT